jgi:integrase
MITKQKSRLVWEVSMMVNGKRVRKTKLLPKAWTLEQANAYDLVNTAKAKAAALIGEATIDDAVAYYAKHRVPELKHDPSMEMAHIDYTGRSVLELRQVCAEYRDTAKAAPATIKNRLRYLTAAVRYWWKRTMPPIPDPAAGVMMPHVDNERHKYITRLQMVRLARACRSPAVRAAIRIAFYSGMRLGEIRRATVRDGCFDLGTTKNGQPRLIPIHPRLYTALQHVIPPKHSVWYHFGVAKAMTGIKGFTFHDLRHSAASEMVNAGVELYTVGAVLGHKSAASTKRYAHLQTERLALAVGKIGRKLPDGATVSIARTQGKHWRRDPESNRTNRICNPGHNRFAIAPDSDEDDGSS